jgi:hypothetical protein
LRDILLIFTCLHRVVSQKVEPLNKREYEFRVGTLQNCHFCSIFIGSKSDIKIGIG